MIRAITNHERRPNDAHHLNVAIDFPVLVVGLAQVEYLMCRRILEGSVSL